MSNCNIHPDEFFLQQGLFAQSKLRRGTLGLSESNSNSKMLVMPMKSLEAPTQKKVYDFAKRDWLNALCWWISFAHLCLSINLVRSSFIRSCVLNAKCRWMQKVAGLIKRNYEFETMSASCEHPFWQFVYELNDKSHRQILREEKKRIQKDLETSRVRLFCVADEYKSVSHRHFHILALSNSHSAKNKRYL